MANLTITVDDAVLERARSRAIEQGTSVNAILAEHLRAFARREDARALTTSTLLSLATQNSQEAGATTSYSYSYSAHALGYEDEHERDVAESSEKM